MTLKSLIFFLAVVGSALPLAGQTFNNRYSFDNFPPSTGFSVEQVDDNFFIFGTTSDSLYKICMHILDTQGIVMESSRIHIDSTGLFIGYSNTSDAFENGFVTAGSLNYGNNVSSGMIAKWDNNGDTLQTKLILPDADNTIILFQQSKVISDGIVAIGSISDGVSVEKIILVKTDFELNELWRKEYGNASVPNAGYSLVQTPDGGFLLGGVRKMANNSWDHCVVKTDENGIQQYIKYHGNENKAYIAHVANAADGNYYFGGRLQLDDDDNYSQVCKLDSELDTIWCKVYGNNGPDCRVNSLKLLPDGNVIICGMDRSNFTMFGYILKIDPDGNVTWYRKYTQTEDNWCFFYDVILTSDGGYFLTGSLSPEVDLTQDIWGLKLDSMGCLVPGCDTADYVFSTRASFGFSVYPNPTTQFVNVYIGLSPTLSKGESVRFELVDMQGRIVKWFSPQLTDATYMLDVEELPAGMYMLSMMLDGEVVHTEKIMKE